MKFITITEYALREGISRQAAWVRIKTKKVKAKQIKLAGNKSIWLIKDS